MLSFFDGKITFVFLMLLRSIQNENERAITRCKQTTINFRIRSTQFDKFHGIVNERLFNYHTRNPLYWICTCKIRFVAFSTYTMLLYNSGFQKVLCPFQNKKDKWLRSSEQKSSDSKYVWHLKAWFAIMLSVTIFSTTWRVHETNTTTKT